MTFISSSHAKQLAIGSRFLASGGGESSLFSQHSFQSETSQEETHIINIDSIKNDSLIVPMVCIGNDIILAEKNFNISHFVGLFQKIEETYGKKVDAIAALSMGGGTIFAPAFVASRLNIPLLDADCYGRTFSEMSMISTNLAGIPPKKAFITNMMGDIVTIECSLFPALDRHARQVTISSGGRCIIVPQVLTGEEAKRGLIAGSLTKALTIGKIIEETHDLNAVMEYTGGKLVGVGGVILSTGLGLPPQFKRRIIIRDTSKERTWEIWMDNEFNMLFENGEMIAEVPDIITLCDPETAEPLTIGQLYLHANVAICAMPAPDVWYSEKGLALARSKRHVEGKIVLCGPSSSSLKRTA